MWSKYRLTLFIENVSFSYEIVTNERMEGIAAEKRKMAAKLGVFIYEIGVELVAID